MVEMNTFDLKISWFCDALCTIWLCNLTPDKSHRIGVSGASRTIPMTVGLLYGTKLISRGLTSQTQIWMCLGRTGCWRGQYVQFTCAQLKQVSRHMTPPSHKRILFEKYKIPVHFKCSFCNMNFSISHNTVTLLVFVRDVLRRNCGCLYSQIWG